MADDLKECACGCGEPAPPRRYGRTPSKFRRGHNTRARGAWKAETKSYRQITVGGRQVPMHRVRARLALGKPLPSSAEVHHVDGGRGDNEQLVICESPAYHRLLHQRTRIVRSGGNPNTDKWCPKCERILPKSAFYRNAARYDGVNSVCGHCHSGHARKQRVEAAIG